MRSQALLAVSVLMLGAPSLWGAGETSHPRLGEPRMLVSGRQAVALLPPELVCGPVVRSYTVSPDERYVLADRQRVSLTEEMLRPGSASSSAPPTESSLVLWDQESGRSREVWGLEGPSVGVLQMEWLPRGEAAFALLTRVEARKDPEGRESALFALELLRIDPATGRTSSQTWTSDAPRHAELSVSPTEPLAVLSLGASRGAAESGPVLQVVDARGRLGPAVAVPEGAADHSVRWDRAGRPVVLALFPDPEGGEASRSWYGCDASAGTLTLLSEPPALHEGSSGSSPVPGAARGLRLREGQAAASVGEVTEPLRVLWLEAVEGSEKPRTLLCTDCDEGRLLRSGGAALYHSQGALYSVSLLRLDQGVLTQAREAARRAETMNRGKQLGLALLMLATDEDDVFPAARDAAALGDLMGKLVLRLGDPKLVQGFQYVFPGGKLDEVENPAETVLGYVPGEGGRAVVYVDGHVLWQPEPAAAPR